jgi:hypothetical protein
MAAARREVCKDAAAAMAAWPLTQYCTTVGHALVEAVFAKATSTAEERLFRAYSAPAARPTAPALPSQPP